jgi:hypothetical protein
MNTSHVTKSKSQTKNREPKTKVIRNNNCEFTTTFTQKKISFPFAIEYNLNVIEVEKGGVFYSNTPNSEDLIKEYNLPDLTSPVCITSTLLKYLYPKKEEEWILKQLKLNIAADSCLEDFEAIKSTVYWILNSVIPQIKIEKEKVYKNGLNNFTSEKMFANLTEAGNKLVSTSEYYSNYNFRSFVDTLIEYCYFLNVEDRDIRNLKNLWKKLLLLEKDKRNS